MTAKEQVIAVYPDAVCMYRGSYCIYIGTNMLPFAKGATLDAAWESALQTIKNETK